MQSDNPDDDPLKELRAAVVSLGQKFKKSTLRQTEGRAERLLKPELATSVESVLKKFVLETAYLPVAKMHTDLGPATFGICAAQETVSCERGRAATMRLQTQGTRQLVLFLRKNSRLEN